MRKVLCALALLIFGAAIMRADDWNKDFAVSGKPELRIDAKDGNVNIATWEKNQINVHVITDGYKIGPQDVRIEDHQTGDHVEVDLMIPHEYCVMCIHFHRSIRLEVRVPRPADLDLRTGDGNITGTRAQGTLRIHTGDGNVELNDLDGNLRADTGDGNVRVQGRFDGLDVRTGDGNVSAEVATGSKMSSSWSVRTGDGNVELELPSDFSADLNLRTGDGRITLDMPVQVSGSLSRSYVHGRLNNGGSTLDVHTGDGSIHLGR